MRTDRIRSDSSNRVTLRHMFKLNARNAQVTIQSGGWDGTCGSR